MRRASRSVILFWQVAVGATALTLWQTLVSLKILDAFFVSRPSDIGQRIVQWVVTSSASRSARRPASRSAFRSAARR